MRRLLTLPYPPSVNRYYRSVGGRVLIAKEGRRYRERVRPIVECTGMQTICRPLRMDILAYPPDSRRRDLDNLFKCLADSLVKAKAIADDSLIDDWRIRRGPVVPGGECVVELETIETPIKETKQ